MAARQYKTLKQQFLRCRTFGHTWDDVTGLPEFTRPGRVQYLRGLRITLRCAVCTTVRRQVWSTMTGECMTTSYNYPKAYKVEAWEGNGTMKEAFRREFLTRRKGKERNVKAS